MRIRGNGATISASLDLGITDDELDAVLGRGPVSTARRDSVASDAEPAESEQDRRAAILASRRALQDVQHAVSLAQVADCALEGADAILLQMQEACSASPSALATSRLRRLMTDLDTLGSETRFGGGRVFADLDTRRGPDGVVRIEAGLPEDFAVEIPLGRFSVCGIDVSEAKVGAPTSNIVAAIDAVWRTRKHLSVERNRMQRLGARIRIALDNQTASASRVNNCDEAFALLHSTCGQIATRAHASIITQGSGLVATVALRPQGAPAPGRLH